MRKDLLSACRCLTSVAILAFFWVALGISADESDTVAIQIKKLYPEADSFTKLLEKRTF
jgi:hypothetical protein